MRLVGDFQSELLADFFDGFARGAKANVHVKTMYGRRNHHKIEAIFKAFARALRGACSRDERMREMLPSTKGLALIAVIDYKAGNLDQCREGVGVFGRGDVGYPRPGDSSGGIEGGPAWRRPLPGHAVVERSWAYGCYAREIAKGTWFLGICVGLQWLFEGSTEAEGRRGWGTLRGCVIAFLLCLMGRS